MAVYKDLLLGEGGGILPSGRTAGWMEKEMEILNDPGGIGGDSLGELYTDLAAKLFEGFERIQGRGRQYLTEAEIQGLAQQAGIGSVESLLCEITVNGADSELRSPPNLPAFMQFVLEHGDQALVDFYLGQKREKLSRLALNACRMADAKNSGSLIARVCAQLDACAMDLDRGPACAYRAVQASFAGNLSHMIDGVILNVQARLDQRTYSVYEQPDSAGRLCEESRYFWYAEKNKSRVRAGKAFGQYVADMEHFIRGQIEVEQLEKLLSVMKKLREQVMEKADSYYLPLKRMTETLFESFQENRKFLEVENASGRLLFSAEEIRAALDSMLEKTDLYGLWKQFIVCLSTAGEDDAPVWMQEKESRIAAAVIRFFAERF